MRHTLDLVYSTTKGYASLAPLFKYMSTQGWQVRLEKVHRNCFRNRKLLKTISPHIVIAYDKPLVRLEKCGWKGKFIYIEHGLSPMKYYTYKYNFFQRADLLFYPGEVFKRKMEAINPQFERGLLGGYPKVDELVNLKIDRNLLCSKYGLNPDKPVILFAPSWGGKRNKNAGIHNAKHLLSLENLLIVPHSADYSYAKKYAAVRPGDGNINQFLHLADVVVSDISSVLAEASILDKPVVQLILPAYPGCFPEAESRKSGIWVSDDILAAEQMTDRSVRPFKIPYIDEDWIMGHTARPAELEEAIHDAIENPQRFSKERTYWAQQSCWKADGHSCKRIAHMIEQYLNDGSVTQLMD
ncbi:MAG: CDP-glycerol glycerophosphotransferase family protein [Candidatus Marinimicrobia bacterium]|nr:CDP-glycerol glycerophosphotransferase family protein [Candidatus Neomarinimicrobiota bacterium]MCF7921452.1 CDP-glycerol glycerophosphotransferase family protein [Candidatus Neomarinimicrobiota bacterium]